MKLLLIVIAVFSSALASGKCPADYDKYTSVEEKVASVQDVIGGATSCDHAVELIKVCAFMIAEYDTLFIDTAMKVCDDARDPLSDEGEAAYQALLKSCQTKYGPKKDADKNQKNFADLQVLFCQLGISNTLSNEMSKQKADSN